MLRNPSRFARFAIVSSLSLFTLAAHATVHDDFAATLATIQAKFQERYALEPWKQKAFRWSIDGQAQKTLREAQANPNLTVPEARVLIQDYFYSARDYHAKAQYSAGGFASLPIGLRNVGTEIYVSNVAATCSCDLELGDRVIRWDGQDPVRVMKSHWTLRYPNHPRTDERDAVRRMVNPYGLLMETMPTSTEAEIVVRKKDGRDVTVKLPWTRQKNARDGGVERSAPIPGVSPDLVGWARIDGDVGEGVAGVGPFDTPLVKPAAVAWEHSGTFFKAWITEGNEKGGAVAKNIGIIRIPTFSVGAAANYTAAVAEFETIVTHMNQHADVLVLDVAANRGGLADYAYALASFFMSREVGTPKFSYRLYPALLTDLDETIAKLDAIKTDAQAVAHFGAADYGGYPVDLTFAKDVRDFYAGLRADAQAGKKYGEPRHYNSARIKPHARVVYTKPVFLHVDEYTASSGDMFAAIFQDTNRAKLIGTWTAGAGAFIGSSNRFTTPLGITSGVIPIALAYRLDGRTPIENLGVLPNIWMAPNRSETKNGYEAYTARVLKTVSRASR